MAGGGEEQQRSRAGRAITWPPRGAVRATGVTEHGSLSLAEKVRSWATAETGPGRLLPWVPVAFGAGIAVYFAADREPIPWVAAVTAVAFCA
ncbi:MAG: competence protein ComEC, partial [Afipia sp.]